MLLSDRKNELIMMTGLAVQGTERVLVTMVTGVTMVFSIAIMVTIVTMLTSVTMVTSPSHYGDQS